MVNRNLELETQIISTPKPKSVIGRRKTTETNCLVVDEENYDVEIANENHEIIPMKSILRKVGNIPFRVTGRAKSVCFATNHDPDHTKNNDAAAPSPMKPPIVNHEEALSSMIQEPNDNNNIKPSAKRQLPDLLPLNRPLPALLPLKAVQCQASANNQFEALIYESDSD